MKKSTKTIIAALLISLLLHGLFFALSPYISLRGMLQVEGQTRSMFRLRGVENKPVDVSFAERDESRVEAIKMSAEASPFENGNLDKDMKMAEKVDNDKLVDAKDRELQKERFEEMLSREMEKSGVQDIMKAEAEKAQKDSAPKTRELEDKLPSARAVTNIITADVSERNVSGVKKQSGVDVKEAETGTWEPDSTGIFRPGAREYASMAGKAQVGEYEDISGYMDVSVWTYTDPATDEKYFKIKIGVKKGVRFKPIPKEVTFLIDSSKSIMEEKLAYIKEAVLDALTDLNPDDRFNLVAFRGDLVSCENSPVRIGPKTIETAKSFIKQLEAVGQTDVGKALLDILKTPVTMYPSYIVLISDGRPTTGVIDSRHIIQGITRRNGMERPIFCFGGGRRVNKYLLDFISYQNRGWSRFAGSTHEIEKDFRAFYAQIKDPLLLNLRYLLLGFDATEVFPKYLSDFYQGKELVLYGRFSDEDIFSMQLLGEMNGSTKEFIFERSLKDSPKGDESIARGWAFTKIYFLISRDTMGLGDPARLRSEIDRLSRKYGITTPYDMKEGD
ncbi:MAG: VWA domain-containing protein [Candidatus Omnitrophota bacterium]